MGNEVLIFSHITTTPGEVTSIRQRRDYISSPLSLYAALDKTNSLLLESAEIDSKDNVKSIILVDAALRIECRGKTVIAKALSNNGQQVLSYLAEQVENCTAVVEDDVLTLEYAPVSYTHLRAHETPEHLVCRLLLEKKK